MDLGALSYTASTGATRQDPLAEGGVRGMIVMGVRNLGPVLVTNLIFAGALWWAGLGWTYLLWVGAYMSTFSLFLRIRAMAEHACTSLVDDPFWHTRTTKANLLARLTVAPHHVNYHLEHHLLMTVPHQSLPRMHALLVERGAIPRARFAQGYAEVLRLVSAGRETEASATPA
ncbi:MAG: fatty acid desaturase, partial [Nannocystaceae bacterium]